MDNTPTTEVRHPWAATFEREARLRKASARTIRQYEQGLLTVEDLITELMLVVAREDS